MTPIPRSHIIALARAWEGTPYHHQASVIGVGTDCLGLVRGVWRDLYGTEPAAVPNYSRDWAEARGEETLWAAARQHMSEIPKDAADGGDVILFRWRKPYPAKHVGILLARQRLIHAFEGLPVTVIKMTPWWWRHAVTAFRFPGVAD